MAIASFRKKGVRIQNFWRESFVGSSCLLGHVVILFEPIFNRSILIRAEHV